MAHVGETVTQPWPAFRDRREAGVRLADFLLRQSAQVDIVVAVPSGGVAVGRPMARALDAPFDMVLVRKLPLPASPEAGFGAVSLSGEVVLNQEMVAAFGLSEHTVARVVHETRSNLEQREEAFLAQWEHAEVSGRHALLVDDGLATGYTMMAAIGELRRRAPATVSVAVPCAPVSSVHAVEALADEVYCLIAQGPGGFAVASYYARWHDLNEEEVRRLLAGDEAPDVP